jgi:uncharacterized RDD family membrane protein YckC
MTRAAQPDTVAQVDWDDELVTGEAVALDLRPASFLLRGAGAAIDALVYFGAYLLLSLLVSLLGSSIPIDDAGFATLQIVLLVTCLVIAPTAVELGTRGRSVGRLAVGTRIVRDDGGAIGFRHAFIRALTGVLELYLTFGGIAVIVALLGRRSKRLGDLLAGTYAQYERVARMRPPGFGMPVELERWATTADVARMPDRLARRIAQFLAQASRLTPETRRRLAGELADEASPYVSPLPDTEAELFLAGVSVLRREREARALSTERARVDALAPLLTGRPSGFPDRG